MDTDLHLRIGKLVIIDGNGTQLPCRELAPYQRFRQDRNGVARSRQALHHLKGVGSQQFANFQPVPKGNSIDQTPQTERGHQLPANPLRDPEDRRLPRIAGPCGMVLFGVTGDLSRKKIMPAIYDLANRGLLPPGFSLVGFARRDWVDQDFAQIVHDSVKEHARTEFREEVWKQLAEGFRFVPGNFDDDHAFETLRRTIEDLDEVRGTDGNHAF